MAATTVSKDAPPAGVADSCLFCLRVIEMSERLSVDAELLPLNKSFNNSRREFNVCRELSGTSAPMERGRASVEPIRKAVMRFDSEDGLQLEVDGMMTVFRDLVFHC